MPRFSLSAAMVLSAALTGCVPPEPSLLDLYREDRTVTRIRRAGELVVALDGEHRALGNAGDADPQGFAVDLAHRIADVLGVEVRFVPLLPRHREEILDPGEVAEIGPYSFGADLVFVVAPLTERLIRTNDVSRPYLVSHQRILVPAGAGVRSYADLEGAPVCTVLDARTGLPPDTVVQTRARAGSVETCRAALGRSGTPVVGTELLLYEVARGPGAPAGPVEVVGERATTEGYGAVVQRGAGGFASFVGAVIDAAVEDGSWTVWHDRWFADLPGISARPPDLTAQEAAALYPTGVELGG